MLLDRLEVSDARLSREHNYFREKFAPLKSYYLYQNMELKHFHHRSGVRVKYGCFSSQVETHYLFLYQLLIPNLY
jgi:hypothetical protein